MAHLRIKRGLDIPIKGKPEGEIQSLPAPQCVSLTFSAFEEAKYTLLK
jgi:Na+-transporting NADH:ubiquinone oxidoreductase subunit NqrA